MNEPTPSPPALDRGGQSPPAARQHTAAFGPSPDTELDLGGLFAELMNAWPLVALITAAVLLGTGLFLFSATPRYQATALLQIEAKTSVMTELKDLSNIAPTGSAADTEIQLIESRSVLEKVVQDEHLLVSARPLHFPVIGTGVARLWEHRHATLAPPLLDLTGYAWGNEAIRVDRFEVPESEEGQSFMLVAGKPGEFDLYSREGAHLLHGHVGDPEVATLPAVGGSGAPGEIQLFVSALSGNPGTRFVVTRRSVMRAVDELRSKFEVSEQGKDTGIIALRLQGEDPAQLKAILEDICEGYLRQNVAQRSADAEKTLQFVEGQLPTLKSQLDKAERALSSYRSKTGAIDLKMEAQAMLDQSVDLDRRLSELVLQRTEMIQHYTAQHPSVIALDSQIEQLERSKADITRELKTLPDSELRSVQLMRDVQVASDLYVLLLNKSQELRIVKSGTVGSARIVDPAGVDATSPVWPKRDVLLLGGLLAGLLLGLIVAGTRRSLDQGVEDPDTLEGTFGLPVVATVPRTRFQRRAAAKRGKPGMAAVLAQRRPKDAAVESLRSLRTVLQYLTSSAGSKIVMITGLRPGVGKSFVSTNLAALIGAGGKRVLLIDGDLRRGVVHASLGTPKGLGLSEVAAGKADIREAIVPTPLTNVFFLPTGAHPPNPSELLLSPHLAGALAWASSEFDLVLLDAPPALGVTDAALMGGHAGVTLLVVQWGLHSPREISLALNRLRQANVRVAGFVFNSVPRRSSAYGYGKYGYVRP